MGIILSALAGAGEGATAALDKQQQRDTALDLQNNQASLQLSNEKAMLQAKMDLADQVRQQQVSRIDSAAQPILDQGVVQRAGAARASQLTPDDMSASNSGQPAGQFEGTARMDPARLVQFASQPSIQLTADQAGALQSSDPIAYGILNIRDPQERVKAAQAYASQVATKKAMVASLTTGDLTDAERSQFAPSQDDRTQARVQAAIQTGDIPLEKVMENTTKQAGVDAKIAMVDQQLDKAKLLHEAYSARTEAQFNAAMAKLQMTNTLTPEMEQVAQGIASGKLAPLAGYAMRTPGAALIMSRVMEMNPDFDATQYGTRQKAEKEFTTGKLGNQARSFNVALSHLETLSGLADALNNGNTQLINQIANGFATQTGSAAPTNFETAKQLVADEIVKAIVGAGGSAGDREKAQAVISKANSPAQLKGAIQTYEELMGGQLKGLEQQYKTSTGKDDFRTRLLSSDVQTMMDRFSRPGAGPTAIRGDADFDALPSGSLFVGPDGVTRRKQ